MKKTALIMAGGKGERFWPKSRTDRPKQFLSLTDDGKTMIQLTVERILPVVDIEDIYIITNEAYTDLVQEQLPEIPVENIICEPIGRNTAPCIGLGAMHVAGKYDDALMVVLPSDHLCKDKDEFIRILNGAFDIASDDENLVTIGITPAYPETGYGYIKMKRDVPYKAGYEVDCFVEKPDLETAKAYLASGDYLWNSGMFIWKLSTICNSMKSFIPETYDSLLKIGETVGTDSYKETLKAIFPTVKSESVDYAIMEKSEDIYIIPGDFGWDDVGSWLAVERINAQDENNNTLKGNVVYLDTKNTTVEGTGNKLIAMIGMDDMIVVDTEDATLICPKSRAGEIKDLLAAIRNNNYNNYL